MKRIKLIYALLLAVTLPLLTACYNDDATAVDNPTQQDGKIKVHLRVSQAAPAVTRADTYDTNAAVEELMNIWTVVITDNANKVVNILSSIPTNREIDPINYKLTLAEGKYNFYSFANIAALDLAKLLGFVDANEDSQDIIPEPSTAGEVADMKVVPANLKFPADGKSPNDYTAKVDGNKFNGFSSENNDNGFGSYGIPMSNHQTFEVTEATADEIIDLIVVRMLAKIELQIYNDKGANVEIESITLTDITKYEEGTANLKLFPNYTNKGNADEMEAVHGDIQPNLNNDYKTEDVKITLDSGKGIVSTANSSDKTPVKITFYVNESATPDRNHRDPSQTTDTNRPTYTENFYHFFLEIKLTDETMARYALIDDNGTKADEKWDYIARNDYRIIPIVLDDYKLDLIPYDFPAIGVYPASVKEEDGIYTINFHDYGHFHLQPVVTKYSTPTTTYVDFTSTTPNVTSYTETKWGLVNNTFTDSWKSWTDASKQASYDNRTGNFYRNQNDTKDGDEAGGEPVWYANTSSPQWQPNATIGYRPFIFGYITDPGESIKNDGDKTVYHEFSIYLYKKGMSTPRLMTYRLYMILDTDQMLYRSRTSSAPRCPHHWH